MASAALSKDDVIIGLNICELREANHHTQKYLAEKINYSDNHLCAVEKGRKPASATMLLRLAEYYNMTLEYFYKGTSWKFQLRHRIMLLARLLEELSDASLDLAEDTIKHLWSLEHENADAIKRLSEIDAEIKGETQGTEKQEEKTE